MWDVNYICDMNFVHFYDDKESLYFLWIDYENEIWDALQSFFQIRQ